MEVPLRFASETEDRPPPPPRVYSESSRQGSDRSITDRQHSRQPDRHGGTRPKVPTSNQPTVTTWTPHSTPGQSSRGAMSTPSTGGATTATSASIQPRTAAAALRSIPLRSLINTVPL